MERENSWTNSIDFKVGQNAFQTETRSFRTPDVIPDHLKKKFNRIDIISEMYMTRDKRSDKRKLNIGDNTPIDG